MKSKKENPVFSSSDAWVFASLILSFKNNEKLNIRKIISAGDYLNHSIFSLKELRAALIKLQKSGIIRISGSGIKLTRGGGRLKKECLKIRKGLVPDIKTALQVLNEKPISISEPEEIFILKAAEYREALKEYENI